MRKNRQKKSVKIALDAVSSLKQLRKEPEQMDLFIRDIEEKYHTKAHA